MVTHTSYIHNKRLTQFPRMRVEVFDRCNIITGMSLWQLDCTKEWTPCSSKKAVFFMIIILCSDTIYKYKKSQYQSYKRCIQISPTKTKTPTHHHKVKYKSLVLLLQCHKQKITGENKSISSSHSKINSLWGSLFFLFSRPTMGSILLLLLTPQHMRWLQL